MKLLLDTHAFLWWITGSEHLSEPARAAIADGANEVYFSAASGWELAIKASLGRVVLPDALEEFMSEQLATNGFDVLPIHLRHALGVRGLPDLHRDPFDRILIAQAIAEGMSLVSGDPRITQYRADVLW
ncbi:MAG: twitching motility protein PilT [Armatimonadetes bacterium RBG_16_67_12]|nr:MAG: twitching motility protein PilT [Armatimonadetes bacterium RBG_16_67_12]